MKRNQIVYPGGVPRWFTYAVHMWSRRRCKRDGHRQPLGSGLCSRCGQYDRDRVQP